MARWSATMATAVLVVAAVVLAATAPAASAQCNAGDLVVCAGAIIGGAAPSASCCSSLRAQQGCFCEYARNPAYSGYINSANARKTLASCRISTPTCS